MSIAWVRDWSRRRKIWIYSEAIDFRKQLNGLVQVVADEMDERPDSGSVYVFRNRQKDKLKLLMWDRNGYVMGYKRLERGRFDFPSHGESGGISLTVSELWQLISGMPMIKVASHTHTIHTH